MDTAPAQWPLGHEDRYRSGGVPTFATTAGRVSEAACSALDRAVRKASRHHTLVSTRCTRRHRQRQGHTESERESVVVPPVRPAPTCRSSAVAPAPVTRVAAARDHQVGAALRPFIRHHAWVPEPGLFALDVDRYVRIVRITVENHATADAHSQSVIITLRPDDPATLDEVTVRFDGVQDLHLRGVSAGALCRLAVEDLSDRGWDQLRYQVADLDEECISLFAQAVSIETPPKSRPA